MSNIAISFEHVSKMYQLGVVGTGTISNDLKRWWNMSVLGKEDPFLKIGQTNDRASKAKSDYVYALRDIDFKVEQGDVVGIIGKNGAGKSTLLKLLSRITAPTTGCIKAKGRIASLLEVGTGFHPELTGRENIYLNGSIMGMTKKEIDAKLDEIVDFSGCEMYIDTPCKRYSSGMQVRLGFAVAAFLEPEILVVDEVLAVGDAEFQKKAIGKMNDVSKGQGRTVLFVSHNMNSVRALCKHGVVLKNGMVEMKGSADECVDFYMDTSVQGVVSHTIIDENRHRKEHIYRDFEFLEVELKNDPKNVSNEEPLELWLRFKRNSRSISQCQFSVVLNGSDGQCAAACYTQPVRLKDSLSVFLVKLVLFNHNLTKGVYSVDLKICQGELSAVMTGYDLVLNVLSFEVKYLDRLHSIPFVYWPRSLGGTCLQETTVELL